LIKIGIFKTKQPQQSSSQLSKQKDLIKQQKEQKQDNGN